MLSGATYLICLVTWCAQAGEDDPLLRIADLARAALQEARVEAYYVNYVDRAPNRYGRIVAEFGSRGERWLRTTVTEKSDVSMDELGPLEGQELLEELKARLDLRPLSKITVSDWTRMLVLQLAHEEPTSWHAFLQPEFERKIRFGALSVCALDGEEWLATALRERWAPIVDGVRDDGDRAHYLYRNAKYDPGEEDVSIRSFTADATTVLRKEWRRGPSLGLAPAEIHPDILPEGTLLRAQDVETTCVFRGVVLAASGTYSAPPQRLEGRSWFFYSPLTPDDPQRFDIRQVPREVSQDQVTWIDTLTGEQAIWFKGRWLGEDEGSEDKVGGDNRSRWWALLPLVALLLLLGVKKKSALALLLLSGLFFACSSGEAHASRLSIEPVDAKASAPLSPEKMSEWSYTIENTSAVGVRALKVGPKSCPCIENALSSRELEPGACATLELQVPPPRWGACKGFVVLQATFEDDTTEEAVLTFFGEVEVQEGLFLAPSEVTIAAGQQALKIDVLYRGEGGLTTPTLTSGNPSVSLKRQGAFRHLPDGGIAWSVELELQAIPLERQRLSLDLFVREAPSDRASLSISRL